MKICIVDDEPEAIKTIEEYLGQSAAKHSIALETESFTDSASFESAFSPGKYAIVFLDIYIDEKSGMDLAGIIRSKSENTMIIFITTSVENMPEAFRFHAFDYVVKPVTYERLDTLFADAIAVLPKLNKYFTFTTNRTETMVLFSDFLWLESNGHYLNITARNDIHFSTRMTTKEFLAKTDGDRRFLSLNKGIVVNMDYIKTISGGNATMTDGTVFPIKVRQAAAIKSQWQNYIFDTLREGQK